MRIWVGNMFESGNVVYHDNLKFKDNVYDSKPKRPCIVLYTIEREDGLYICTCPITSQIKSFNKYPDNHFLIPEVIYNEKKINFAKLNNLDYHHESVTHETGISIGENSMNLLIERIINYNTEDNDIIQIKEYLKSIKTIKDMEQKQKIKKLSKNEKRRIAKKSLL